MNKIMVKILIVILIFLGLSCFRSNIRTPASVILKTEQVKQVVLVSVYMTIGEQKLVFINSTGQEFFDDVDLFMKSNSNCRIVSFCGNGGVGWDNSGYYLIIEKYKN